MSTAAVDPAVVEASADPAVGEASFTSGAGTAFPPTIADGVDFTGLADPEDNGHHAADDSGISMVFRNDDMTVKPEVWENIPPAPASRTSGPA